MTFIMELFGAPLGFILWFLYHIVENYAVALILFTIVVKLCLIPLAIKQQKGNIKMQIIQPKIREIQNKYKDGKNQMEMQQELQELYKKEEYSMTAGCMPMLIQMPILFGLIDVVYRPLTHILRLSQETIASFTATMQAASIDLPNYAPEIAILKTIKDQPDLFADLDAVIIQSVLDMEMMFLGIDMALTPSFGFGLENLMFVPVLSAITAYIMSSITMKNSPSAADPAAAGNMKVMMFMGPIMSLWFTSIVPVGVGLYWIIGNLFGCVQAIVLNKLWNPREIAEKLKAEEEARILKEREERKEAKRLAKENGERAPKKSLNKKEANRQKLSQARERNNEQYLDEEEQNLDQATKDKLAAARKRNAEKYGDHKDTED